MPAVARIESTLGFNDAQFTQGIERAEKRAATFGGRVEATFNNLFRKTPGRRAEKALTGLVGDIATGSLSQGVMSFAGRLTGLGLAAGVGVGVAIELFDKLHDSVKEVRAAHEGLEKQMSKPMSIMAGLSPEGISEQASQLSASLEKLREVRSSVTHGIVGYLEDFAKQKGNIITDSDFGKSGLSDTKEESDAQQRLNAVLAERGKIELELARARKANQGDDTKTALDAIYFGTKQKISAIELEGGKGARDRIEALRMDERRLTDEVAHRSEVREHEFKTSEKLLKLQRSDLPDDKKKALAASIQLASINESLAGPDVSASERRSLTLEKLKTENELRAATQNTANPFAYGTMAHRDFENESGFGSLAQRNKDMNDSSVWGSLGYNAMQRGELPQTKQEGPDILKALTELVNLTRQVWATP